MSDSPPGNTPEPDPKAAHPSPAGGVAGVEVAAPAAVTPALVARLTPIQRAHAAYVNGSVATHAEAAAAFGISVNYVRSMAAAEKWTEERAAWMERERKRLVDESVDLEMKYQTRARRSAWRLLANGLERCERDLERDGGTMNPHEVQAIANVAAMLAGVGDPSGDTDLAQLRRVPTPELARRLADVLKGYGAEVDVEVDAPPPLPPPPEVPAAPPGPILEVSLGPPLSNGHAGNGKAPPDSP